MKNLSKIENEKDVTTKEYFESITLPTKSVTLAQYNALSNAQKQADIQYIVTDDDSISVNIESVEEYDTNDGWHIRKWSNGYIEMSIVRSIEIKVEQWTLWGQGYIVDSIIPQILLPVKLVKRYYVNTEASTHGGYGAMVMDTGMTGGYNPLKTLARYSLYRGTIPPSAFKYDISSVVVGRWK